MQNSVFERIIDPARLKQLQNTLLKLMDVEKDSVRYYFLGDAIGETGGTYRCQASRDLKAHSLPENHCGDQSTHQITGWFAGNLDSATT